MSQIQILKAELITFKIPESQNFFHNQNQPISVDSKKIEVVVTWKEEPFRVMKDGKKYPARKFRQTFFISTKLNLKAPLCLKRGFSFIYSSFTVG